MARTEGSMKEVVNAEGHDHVTARHRSTLEVTTDAHLTRAGDCIIGVAADRAPADFGRSFVEACRSASASIEAIVEVDGAIASIRGRGDPDLTFGSDRSAVIRTSTFVDDRTVMVEASAAAGDLDRRLVERLRDGADLILRMTVDP